MEILIKKSINASECASAQNWWPLDYVGGKYWLNVVPCRPHLVSLMPKSSASPVVPLIVRLLGACNVSIRSPSCVRVIQWSLLSRKTRKVSSQYIDSAAGRTEISVELNVKHRGLSPLEYAMLQQHFKVVSMIEWLDASGTSWETSWEGYFVEAAACNLSYRLHSLFYVAQSARFHLAHAHRIDPRFWSRPRQKLCRPSLWERWIRRRLVWKGKKASKPVDHWNSIIHAFAIATGIECVAHPTKSLMLYLVAEGLSGDFSTTCVIWFWRIPHTIYVTLTKKPTKAVEFWAPSKLFQDV